MIQGKTLGERVRRRFRGWTQPLLWRWYQYYLSKTRYYQRHGLRIEVTPTVFHPGLLFSTKILLEYCLQLPIKGKKILELGAGSGLITATLSKEGGQLVATDINPAAVKALKATRDYNQLDYEVIESDLFQALEGYQFDLIAINPPYFPQNPTDARTQAFFCGANFEYFHRLFATLRLHLLPEAYVLMILSDDCDLKTIESIALEAGFTWQEVYQEKVWGETNLIYQIS